MKKLLNGDKGGFKCARAIVSLVLFLSLQNNICPQIKLNGFYSINKYPTSNFKLFIEPVDFNNDRVTDLFFYGSQNERITLHPGGKKFDYSKSIDKFFYYLISDFKKFNFLKGLDQNYIFISRKERITGLVSFTKYGGLRLLNTLQFDSYPSKLRVEDFDLDGTLEAIAFGSNFRGISIIRQNLFKLSQQKLLPNRIFSDAIFVDLDYDTYPELAAIDELSKSLIIFSNDQEGNFREDREVEIEHTAKNLAWSDINDDGFSDVLYSTKTGIQILMGDSVSSMNEKFSIKCSSEPGKFFIADFNNDLNKDICFVLPSSGAVSIAFGGGKAMFDEPVTIFSDENLTDCNYFYRDERLLLALITSDGKFYTIGDSVYNPDKFHIPTASEPHFFGSIRTSSASPNQIYIINNDAQQLNILTIENNTEISSQTNYNLIESYDEVHLSIVESEKCLFTCWKKGGMFIDEINFDRKLNLFSTERVLTEIPIWDFIHPTGRKDMEQRFISLVNDSLFITKFNQANNEESSPRKDFIDSNVVDAKFAGRNSASVYYWTKNDTSLKLQKDQEANRDKNILFAAAIDSGNSVSVFSSASEDFTSGRYIVFGITQPINKLFVLAAGSLIEVTGSLKLKEISSEAINNIKIYHDMQSGRNFLFSYQKKRLFTFALDIAKRELKLINYIDSLNIKNYFISKLFSDSTYLIYSSQFDNILSFLKLDEIP